jgi:diaminohydroxyphosphoribosylaminopyrimidine deaminase/5-amino-6-(5-phosphoribosylamino)uracil reductase
LTDQDNKYMRRCFELARKGLGLTRTNPLVGCVIVHGERIIGEGYHHEFGGPHAEVNAIRSVRQPELLPESTLYCSLEPCAHYGKTPPCSMLIAQKKIRRVVISNLDPFPSVNGKGVLHLQEAGAVVESGCLAEEGAYINRRFFTYHLRRRPYVVLKWAQTQDGFLDLVREPGDPIGTNWITSRVCRTLVHKWRSEEAAIMVGTNTIVTDDPQLNIRRWAGENPVRVTLDRTGRIPRTAHIVNGSQDTIVFAGHSGGYTGKTRSIPLDPSYGLADLLEELHDQKVVSVMVEGGARLLQSFLEEGLWDEARVFTGKLTFSQGVAAPVIPMDPVDEMHINTTRLEIFRNHSGMNETFESGSRILGSTDAGRPERI